MTLFAQYIRDAREDKGLSLTEGAELIGCTKSHLWDLEHGRSNNPTISTLVGIAKAYDLYFDDLAMAAAASIEVVLST